MKNILVLRTSINGADSFSNRMANAWLARHPDCTITERNLADNPIPVLMAHSVGAIRGGLADTDERRAALKLSDELVAELQAADAVVIALGRYNFSVPATFKTWIDYIARPRITFRYGENGAEGLLPDIPVIAMIANGGVYEAQNDTLTPWLKQVLAFVGLKNLTVIQAQGTAFRNHDDIMAEVVQQM